MKVASLSTFTHCKECYTTISRVKQSDDKRIDLVLVGNKSDLPQSEHEVSYDDGQRMADEWGVPFIQTSAKDNVNIQEAFQTLAHEYAKHKEVPQIVEQDNGCACKIL